MLPDGSSSSTESSADAGRTRDQSWPPPESEISDTEDALVNVQTMIAQVEQTIQRAKAHLAALIAEAPALRNALVSAGDDQDVPQMTNMQAARGLRSELVKVSQQSVTVSQKAAKYLQARERFLLARRDWDRSSKKLND